MDLKAGLKWIFFLFCIIFTFQVLATTVIIDGFLQGYAAPHVYSRRSLMEAMLVALAGSLPTLVLVQGKVLSRIPMSVRRTAHFLLTFGAVFGLVAYFNSFELSGWFLLPLGLFLIIYVLAIFFYEKYILTKRKARQKAEQQKHLQFYTDEIERQYIGIQKFKHDYQNILFSLDCFIHEDDWAGLKQYYMTKIKKASEVVTRDIFSLEGLSKIKVKEIKSILVGKLILAQNMGIDTAFHADDEIACFYMDSVDLVRMLGILLDNAIEELTEFAHGTLSIGCFKEETGVTIVVQNTCRPDHMPKLHEIWKLGFSTKGNGRGLGLNTLSELAGAHPNLILETTIAADSFVQKLKIGKR